MALCRFKRVSTSNLGSSLHIHSYRNTGGSVKDIENGQAVAGLPSFRESMRNSNKLWNLGAKESEYSKFFTVSEPVFAALDRVDELYNAYENELFPESDLNISSQREYTKPGYNNSSNPYNAWQCQCEILPGSNVNIEESILKGKKIVLKDTINVAQLPMQNGSAMLDDYICKMDASIVSRILDNGGIIVGKSSNEDLCYSGGSHTGWPHPVKNPHDTDCHAGGSSSGTAVLVSTQGKTNEEENDVEMVNIGISGDQGGSIRIPACWCGVFGFKPTWGLVPYTGVAQISAHFDHVGPCATNMTDLCDLLTSIAGKDGIDIRQLNAPNYQSSETDFRNLNIFENGNNNKDGGGSGLTIGILKEGFSLADMDDSIVTCVKDALSQLGGGGNNGIKDIKEVSIPIHNDMTSIWCAIGYESQYTTMYQYGGNGVNCKNRVDPMLNHIWKCSMNSTKNTSHLLSHTNKQNMMIGQYLLNRTQLSSFGEYFGKGSLLAEKSREIYEDIMKDNNIDVLICPTLPSLTKTRPDTNKIFGNEESCTIEMVTHALSMIGNTAPFNVTGSPALTIPLEIKNQTSGNGGKLFAGMQVIGKLWDDKSVLKMGHIVQESLLK